MDSRKFELLWARVHNEDDFGPDSPMARPTRVSPPGAAFPETFIGFERTLEALTYGIDLFPIPRHLCDLDRGDLAPWGEKRIYLGHIRDIEHRPDELLVMERPTSMRRTVIHLSRRLNDAEIALGKGARLVAVGYSTSRREYEHHIDVPDPHLFRILPSGSIPYTQR